jgi:DegV family protein with EDD domain
VRLTTDNTALVLDSTSDYPEAPSRFPNMRVVPLYVRFGDETFRDYVDLGPHDFYEKLRTSTALPATSQPTPQDFLTTYQELSSYERIYSLQVSSKVSGTFQSAELAASELGGERVRVVDTLSVSLAVAMLAHAIQRRLARGTSDEEIDELISRFKRADIEFTATLGAVVGTHAGPGAVGFFWFSDG